MEEQEEEVDPPVNSLERSSFVSSAPGVCFSGQDQESWSVLARQTAGKH